MAPNTRPSADKWDSRRAGLRFRTDTRRSRKQHYRQSTGPHRDERVFAQPSTLLDEKQMQMVANRSPRERQRATKLVPTKLLHGHNTTLSIRCCIYRVRDHHTREGGGRTQKTEIMGPVLEAIHALLQALLLRDPLSLESNEHTSRQCTPMSAHGRAKGGEEGRRECGQKNSSSGDAVRVCVCTWMTDRPRAHSKGHLGAFTRHKSLALDADTRAQPAGPGHSAHPARVSAEMAVSQQSKLFASFAFLLCRLPGYVSTSLKVPRP